MTIVILFAFAVLSVIADPALVGSSCTVNSNVNILFIVDVSASVKTTGKENWDHQFDYMRNRMACPQRSSLLNIANTCFSNLGQPWVESAVCSQQQDLEGRPCTNKTS